MIKLGKVYKNLMVVKTQNKKLREIKRIIMFNRRIIQEAKNANLSEKSRGSYSHDGNRADYDMAYKLLEKENGFVAKAIEYGQM